MEYTSFCLSFLVAAVLSLAHISQPSSLSAQLPVVAVGGWGGTYAGSIAGGGVLTMGWRFDSVNLSGAIKTSAVAQSCADRSRGCDVERSTSFLLSAGVPLAGSDADGFVTAALRGGAERVGKGSSDELWRLVVGAELLKEWETAVFPLQLATFMDYHADSGIVVGVQAGIRLSLKRWFED